MGQLRASELEVDVLRQEVSSADVATAIVLLAGTSFSKTTGAQLPVDSGNERVI